MSLKTIMEVGKEDLKLIADGGAVLGSGGGGNPYLGRLIAEQVLGDEKTVPVIGIDELEDDALILPVAMMGAPAVMLEKFPSGNEIPALISTIEKLKGKKISALLCIEAGGLNSTTPFIAAAQTGLPLVDGDGMGRAFPELQMVSFTLGGIGATPMAMFDEKGNGATFDTISNSWTERLARALTIEMGGMAMVGLYTVTAAECRDYLIKGSLSLARDIGQIMDDFGAQATSVIADTYKGTVLFSGRVRDVERIYEGGFTKGTVRIEGKGDFRNREAVLSFQNEFLLAKEGDRTLATTPDLITLLDANTSEAVTTEMVKYGLSVNVLGLPCDPIWRTEAGLALAGPDYFKLGVDYSPI